eukprot:8484481-Pyramimonas_sp.AAC.1
MEMDALIALMAQSESRLAQLISTGIDQREITKSALSIVNERGALAKYTRRLVRRERCCRFVSVATALPYFFLRGPRFANAQVENSIFEKVEEAETLRVQLDDARAKAEEESHEAAFADVLAGGLAEVMQQQVCACVRSRNNEQSRGCRNCYGSYGL